MSRHIMTVNEVRPPKQRTDGKWVVEFDEWIDPGWGGSTKPNSIVRDTYEQAKFEYDSLRMCMVKY